MKTEIVKEALIKTLKEIDEIEGNGCGVGLCYIVTNRLGYDKTIVKLILKFNKRPIKLDRYSYPGGDGSSVSRRDHMWYYWRRLDIIDFLYYLENEHKSDNIYLKDF